MPLPMYQEKPPHPLSKVRHVIAVAAGKGGVGKSTVSVNLALSLRKKGYAVGVMDADVYGPSIRQMLPEDQMPAQKEEMIRPALCCGVKMISLGYFRPENEAASVRAPIANGIIQQFIQQVDWGELDYLFIDFPPGTGDVQLTLGQKANLSAALMVTTPQEVAMLDVRKAMNLFEKLSIPILGIAENMSYYLHKATNEEVYLFGKGGGEKLARESGVPYLGGIPADPLLSEYSDAGKSVFHTEDSAARHVQQSFANLAKKLNAHAEALQSDFNGTLASFELVWEENQ